MSVSKESVSSKAEIDVAVALIVRKDGKILTVFNEKWGAFTLPMTKRRTLADDNQAVLFIEPWEDAAARAAVEVLSAPCFATPVDIRIEYSRMRGRRDGLLKQYNYRVFKICYLPNGPYPEPRPGCLLAWLSAEQITAPVQKALRPISASAYQLVACIRLNAPDALKTGIDMEVERKPN